MRCPLRGSSTKPTASEARGTLCLQVVMVERLSMASSRLTVPPVVVEHGTASLCGLLYGCWGCKHLTGECFRLGLAELCCRLRCRSVAQWPLSLALSLASLRIGLQNRLCVCVCRAVHYDGEGLRCERLIPILWLSLVGW